MTHGGAMQLGYGYQIFKYRIIFFSHNTHHDISDSSSGCPFHNQMILTYLAFIKVNIYPKSKV